MQAITLTIWRHVIGFRTSTFSRSAGGPAGKARRHATPRSDSRAYRRGGVGSERRTRAPIRFGLLAALALALAACHGIQPNPASPTRPARSNVPVRLALVHTPGELPIGGGSVIVSVEAIGADGFGVSTSVALAVSTGELGVDHVVTDRTGYATASWHGTQTATITGTAGDVVTIGTIPVNEPVVPLPNPPPQPQPPAPAPTPLPPIPPSLTMSVSASPLQVALFSPVTLTATVMNLNSGEQVIAYQWDWEGHGRGETFDETSRVDNRPHTYLTDGIKTPLVLILTSSGRQTSAAGRVIVYKP